MQMTGKILASVCLLALGACTNGEMGAQIDSGAFGNATMHNSLVQTGELDYAIALAERFNKEVPDTVTFAFNSAVLTPEARSILDRQAAFIRHFPEVRFKVFGHTDLVGGQGYNKALGLQRANAVVNHLVSRGISRKRLEAVVSYGKTRPIIQTQAPEQRNRRTVTEVSGFVKNNPLILNGKYAEVVWRSYTTELAQRPHPGNSVIQTQITPDG